MAVPTSSNSQLQQMLQSAVQAVQWTYSLFWQYCPQQGILVWRDGYYNGAIKTRKTVQPMDTSADEACLQRSQQLRELYESLSAGELNQPARRPCAALSPEDLTESEWFYLMCVSFSFPPGVGLPGKAFVKGQHMWLTGANEVDSRVFSRAILAKSARIQTVMCIPVTDGVVELGYTERVQEDLSFVQRVKSLFSDDYCHQLQPKPALSEHSTSNPTISSNHFHFQSTIAPSTYETNISPHVPCDGTNGNDDDEEIGAEADSMSRDQIGPGLQVRLESGFQKGVTNIRSSSNEPSELMQMEMSEEIQLSSPNGVSDNLHSDFSLLVAGPPPSDSFITTKSTRRWPPIMQHHQQLQDPLIIANVLQPSLSSITPMEEISQENKHYSQTISVILQVQSSRCTQPSSTTSATSSSYLSYSTNSAFMSWKLRFDDHQSPVDGTSQWLLKYILFTVPFLHSKYREENVSSPKSALPYTTLAHGKGSGGAPQDELSANHVLAERRRREKLNERFVILRSLVPFVTKMDKASILGDTIEYVKQLRMRIQELEGHTKSGEETDKKRVEVAEESRKGSGMSAKVLGPTMMMPQQQGNMLEVSIIESDALVEMQCPFKEGLLLEVMIILRNMRLEVSTVQSSLNDDFLVAELRAKVKENVNGKRPSIIEVKRAVNQIIPQSDT